MDLDQQIAQADFIATEALLTSPVSPNNNRTRVDELREDEFNSLPFGAIQLDTDGMVLKYNGYESRLAGVKKENAVGKNFFTEVAPCTNVKEFYGRFRAGVERKSLHEKFRYHFALSGIRWM
ncbi:MAG: PAS domain-containing protein [Terriglobales bacterium]